MEILAVGELVARPFASFAPPKRLKLFNKQHVLSRGCSGPQVESHTPDTAHFVEKISDTGKFGVFQT